MDNTQKAVCEVGGDDNKTEVIINGEKYLRYGAYYPKVTNGKIIDYYKVVLSNTTDCFHSNSSLPTSATSTDRYMPTEKFVFL